jgi:GntR family transcriptional regulator, vanillate catabolism transcriptional regulator
VGDAEEIRSTNQPAEGDSQTARTILRLREMILRGEFAPGERISEYPLTGRLGVSRTPIRLALERLAHEGLIEPYPTGGFIVRVFTLEDVWDAIELRGIMEGSAARFAAERLVEDSELNGLRERHREMDALGKPTTESFPRYMDLNDAFHAEIVRLAKSNLLERAFDRVFTFPFVSAQAVVPIRPNFEEAAEIFVIGREHHHRIIEAISRRQGTRAESIWREHAQLGRRNLEIAMKDKEFLNYMPGGPLIRTL